MSGLCPKIFEVQFYWDDRNHSNHFERIILKSSIVKLDGLKILSIELLWLQICSGIDENAVGTCSELVFAPIDEMFPDDAPLLPSGFRVIPLDPKSVELNVFQLDLHILC